MRQFSVAARKPLDRKKATSALIVNQFATPGLGSLLCRRYIAGIGQLLLAVVGFCLLMLWFFFLLLSMYANITGGRPQPSHNLYGKIGGILFVGSWLWAWVTSLSLMREAKRNQQAATDFTKPL